MVCAAVYRPVCGSDGMTHSNECSMKMKECVKNTIIFKVHNGECGRFNLFFEYIIIINSNIFSNPQII